MEQNGTDRNRLGWNGKGRNKMGWNGAHRNRTGRVRRELDRMGQVRIEWDGMGRVGIERDRMVRMPKCCVFLYSASGPHDCITSVSDGNRWRSDIISPAHRNCSVVTTGHVYPGTSLLRINQTDNGSRKSDNSIR